MAWVCFLFQGFNKRSNARLPLRYYVVTERTCVFLLITCRPRYFPQDLHTLCGKAAAPQSGQITVFTVGADASHALCFWRLRVNDGFFFGTAPMTDIIPYEIKEFSY